MINEALLAAKTRELRLLQLEYRFRSRHNAFPADLVTRMRAMEAEVDQLLGLEVKQLEKGWAYKSNLGTEPAPPEETANASKGNTKKKAPRTKPAMPATPAEAPGPLFLEPPPTQPPTPPLVSCEPQAPVVLSQPQPAAQAAQPQLPIQEPRQPTAGIGRGQMDLFE